MYECPNCGNNVKYNIEAKTMKCDSCDSTFDPLYFEKQTSKSEQKEYFDTMVYTCPQCGGELIGDVNEAAVFCSYCGTSNILEEKMIHSKRPKYIIPFSRTKEDCKKDYMRHMKGAIFAPKELKNSEYIDSFRAIYMPYWSYDLKQKGKVSFKGEREFRKGDYIITDEYLTSGYLKASYEGYSMDAASSFDDNLSQAIAPFHYQEKVPFTPAYMSGFYADVADVDKTVYSNEAQQFAMRESMKRIKASKGVDPGLIKPPEYPSELNTKITETSNCMYPVWFLSYRNKDRVAYAVVNGQTGKVAADIPIDLKKYGIGVALLTIPLFLFLNLFFTFRPYTLVILATIMSLVCGVISWQSEKRITDREKGKTDKGVQHVQKNTEIASDAYRSVLYHPVALWVICFVIGVLGTGLWSPVSDIPYYGAVLVNIAYMLYMLIITIRNYNRFATRKLPQFNRSGGDDNA